MAFLKPQSPLQKDNDYFYPLTTMDQIIVDENYRMNDLVGRIQKSTFTLYSNKWSSSYPYTQSISINGLSDDKNFKFYPKYPNDIESKKQIKNEYNKIDFTSNSGNVLTFECWDDIPDINIEMIIEISMTYPLEGMINDDVKAMLPVLNYSVIDGTVEPANPTENMIWVNTNINITNYIFSKNEPIKTEGLVWFITDDNSNISFYSMKLNNKNVDEILVTNVKQYINGQWIGISAKIYQNKKWHDFKSYILYDGILNEDYGSWVPAGDTYFQNGLIIGRANTDIGGAGYLSQPIDVSKYSAIRIHCQVTAVNSTTYCLYFGIAKTIPVSENYSTQLNKLELNRIKIDAPTNGFVDCMLDLSGFISGLYYLQTVSQSNFTVDEIELIP